MAYAFDINHQDRIIDFGIYTSMNELLNGRYAEKENEGDPPQYITKLNMFRLFLKDNREFFTVKEISEILNVSRKTIETQGIWSGKLKTYTINYFFVPGGTPDKTKWKKEDHSNIRMVIHQKDLHDFLLGCVKSSFKYEYGYSVIREQTKELKDDLLREKSKLIEASEFVIFLQHQCNHTEIEKLVDMIVNRKVHLRSKSTLQRLFDRSDTSYTRFMKCYDTIRFNFNNTKKDTTRMIFDVKKDDEIMNIVKARMNVVNSHKVKIIPAALKQPFQQKEFEEPIDYLSLYIEGYEELPAGYYVEDEKFYFAIERGKTVLHGVNIRKELEMRRKIAEAIRQTMKPL